MKSQLVLNDENGVEFLAKGDSDHQITIGFSEDIGGKDNGPSPMELLLHGIAGCTGIDILLI